jgi:mono/diheme cytochrome c family protein
MAVFLKDLPQAPAKNARPSWFSWFSGRGSERVPKSELRTRGAKLYERECSQCHGDSGEGAPHAYPALARNRAVTMPLPANLIRVLLSGGFPPATPGNPRPYGMPPFAQTLSDAEIAELLTFIRSAWGNSAAAVSQLDVMRYRTGQTD